MDILLERHKLPKFAQKNIDNCNRSTAIKVIGFVFLNLPHNKIPNPNGFTG